MHLCPPHSLGAGFYLPPQRGTAAGVRSRLLPPASSFPTTQPGSALIGAALPTPSFSHLAGAVLTFRDRGHQPHLPPTLASGSREPGPGSSGFQGLTKLQNGEDPLQEGTHLESQAEKTGGDWPSAEGSLNTMSLSFLSFGPIPWPYP